MGPHTTEVLRIVKRHNPDLNWPMPSEEPNAIRISCFSPSELMHGPVFDMHIQMTNHWLVRERHS